MTSLTLRPWMPFAIEPSASTWQHTSRAWAMDTVWSFTARLVQPISKSQTHTLSLPLACQRSRGSALPRVCLYSGNRQKERGLWESEGLVALDT